MRRTRGALVAVLLLAACASLGRRASIYYVTVASELAPSTTRITIRRDFLERYRNRVTIDTRFTVDAAADSPNPDAFDGDLHFSGRAPEVGLRMVSEIKNAALAPEAVRMVGEAAKVRRTLALTGAWRIWPEHSLGAREFQGDSIPPLETPYPDHVFEVHPVTRLAGLDLLNTFRVIDGYKAGSAERTLGIYEDAECTVSATAEAVTLTTATWLYNDVHFLMEATAEPPQVVADGRFLTARALDRDGTPLVEKVRLVFVLGSEPERRVRGIAPGTRLHVWGLPRISLAGIAERLRGQPAGAAPVKGALPYELVIIGIYPDG